VDEDGDFANEEDRAVHLAFSQRTSRDPAPFLDSAIDLGAWLGESACADREVLAARYAGDSLKEIGSRADRSVSAVFQSPRDLGADLAEDAGIVLLPRK
jgi:hypothetical protein